MRARGTRGGKGGRGEGREIPKRCALGPDKVLVRLVAEVEQDAPVGRQRLKRRCDLRLARRTAAHEAAGIRGRLGIVAGVVEGVPHAIREGAACVGPQEQGQTQTSEHKHGEGGAHSFCRL